MLSDDIDAYLAHAAVAGLATDSVGVYRQRLERLAAWLAERRGYRRWAEVRADDLDTFLLDLQAQGLRRSTRAGFATVIRLLGAWLTQRGRVLANPARDLPVPDDLTTALPPAPLSEAEVARLIDAVPRRHAVDLRNRCHLELLYGCGLRLAESLGLRTDDVDLAARLVVVRHGKGDKRRVLPLLAPAAGAVRDYLAVRRDLLAGPDHGALLLGHGGRPLPASSFQQWLRRFGRALGLDVHPHLLRHSFAVHLLRGGADLRHIAALLGHGDLETTRIYLRLVPGQLREAYDAAMPAIPVNAPTPP
jgi:site-specific recombinase XerD